METVFFKGAELDVVELFPEFVVVQDPNSKAVFLLAYEQIDPPSHPDYNDGSIDGNVISLEGYLLWQRNLELQNLSQNSQSRANRRQKPSVNLAKVLPLRAVR